MEKTYVIQNAEADYYEHDFGWTEFEENATRYTGEQFNTVNLPIGGYWVEVQQ